MSPGLVLQVMLMLFLALMQSCNASKALSQFGSMQGAIAAIEHGAAAALLLLHRLQLQIGTRQMIARRSLAHHLNSFVLLQVLQQLTQPIVR